MIKIGNVEIDAKHILAPISGVSDQPYRVISRLMGCKFAFAGMLSSRALAYNNKSAHRMLSSIPQDAPLGVQLLGFEHDFLKMAIEKIEKYPFKIIDFNAFILGKFCQFICNHNRVTVVLFYC